MKTILILFALSIFSWNSTAHDRFITPRGEQCANPFDHGMTKFFYRIVGHACYDDSYRHCIKIEEAKEIENAMDSNDCEALPQVHCDGFVGECWSYNLP